MMKGNILLFSMLLIWSSVSNSNVVINEIFYNAPDDIDTLQWIEFFNPDNQPVDMGNWGLNKGSLFLFPSETIIESKGFLVVALEPELFSKHYSMSAMGPLKQPLNRGKDKIELYDAQGKLIDKVSYKDEAPWPVSADGYSSSLERICPIADGDDSDNWAASPLPMDSPKPSGSPGSPNAAYSSTLPPVIGKVKSEPEDLLGGQPLTVQAKIKSSTEQLDVRLLYRVIVNGVESSEEAISMKSESENEWFSAQIPAQSANTLVRYRIKVLDASGSQRIYPSENDIRPSLSTYVHDVWDPAQISYGLIVHVGKEWIEPENQEPRRRPRGFNFFGFGNNQPEAPRPPRGSSAFVYVDHQSGKTELFDYINIIDRFNNRGYKAFFHKDQPLNGMTSVNIAFEGNERFLLAEPLAYDLYRRTGNVAPQCDFLRLWVDGQLKGYHLLIERPNRNFLRNNNINENGDLFKLRWTGRDIASRYEKKTNPTTGHDNLIDIIEKLQNTEGMEQWKIIQENFNVDRVADYFALNMILSHWDGFFNNHFVYHDLKGKNKWEIYPWDQDKTWGYYDGISANDVFVDMPLTFGMEGDAPPNRDGQRPNEERFNRPPSRAANVPQAASMIQPPSGESNRAQGDRPGRQSNGNNRSPMNNDFFGGGGMFMGRGAMWWRAGGELSRPLLANSEFRKIFLKRVKTILDTFYTEEIYLPVIDAMADRLKEDVVLLSKLYGETGAEGVEMLSKNVASLKTHLQKRREFLLKQEELQNK